MKILCLLEKLEENQLTMYNTEIKESFTVTIPDNEVGIYQSLLDETKEQSLEMEEFDEPALAIVFYDTENKNVSVY